MDNANSSSKSIVPTQILIEELEFTDQIQSMLEYGNQYKLRSFKLRLLMESTEESVSDAKKSPFSFQNEIDSGDNN